MMRALSTAFAKFPLKKSLAGLVIVLAHHACGHSAHAVSPKYRPAAAAPNPYSVNALQLSPVVCACTAVYCEGGGCNRCVCSLADGGSFVVTQ